MPTKIAIEGLTVAQSNWKENTSNHSIAELVSHLIFWNETNLKAFKGDTPTNWDNDNEHTFKKFKATDWKIAVKKLDSIQTEWERVIEKATDDQIDEWKGEIASMSAHTAYHTGQIHNEWWK